MGVGCCGLSQPEAVAPHALHRDRGQASTKGDPAVPVPRFTVCFGLGGGPQVACQLPQGAAAADTVAWLWGTVTPWSPVLREPGWALIVW